MASLGLNELMRQNENSNGVQNNNKQNETNFQQNTDFLQVVMQAWHAQWWHLATWNGNTQGSSWASSWKQRNIQWNEQTFECE